MQIEDRLPVNIKSYLLEIILIVLLVILYSPVMLHWYDGWLHKSISIEHEYFSHGIIGLPFAAYLCWKSRHQWAKLSEKPHFLGAGLLGLGGTLYLSGLTDLVNLSFPAMLAGICLWLKGIAGLKLYRFPLLLIFLATPTSIPYLLTPYTLPLQSLIATIVGWILVKFGMDVTVDQIYLSINEKIIEVAPNCIGLKLLFSSLYISLILLQITGTFASFKKTSLLLLGSILISFIGNIIRNTLLTIFHGQGQDFWFEWLHSGWGGDLYSMILLSLLVLLLSGIDKCLSTGSKFNTVKSINLKSID